MNKSKEQLIQKIARQLYEQGAALRSRVLAEQVVDSMLKEDVGNPTHFEIVPQKEDPQNRDANTQIKDLKSKVKSGDEVAVSNDTLMNEDGVDNSPLEEVFRELTSAAQFYTQEVVPFIENINSLRANAAIDGESSYRKTENLFSKYKKQQFELAFKGLSFIAGGKSNILPYLSTKEITHIKTINVFINKLALKLFEHYKDELDSMDECTSCGSVGGGYDAPQFTKNAFMQPALDHKNMNAKSFKGESKRDIIKNTLAEKKKPNQ